MDAISRLKAWSASQRENDARLRNLARGAGMSESETLHYLATAHRAQRIAQRRRDLDRGVVRFPSYKTGVHS